MTSLYLLTLLLTLETPTQGVLRWGILSAFPKPMPVRFNAAVFPRFFTTNSSMNLPYLAKDTVTAPLGENRSFFTEGSLCFSTQNLSKCIHLKQRKYGWFDKAKITVSHTNPTISVNMLHSVLWINGTFVNPPNSTHSHTTSPQQPKYSPHCLGNYEGELWPWTDCQSHKSTWADVAQRYTISPRMLDPILPGPNVTWDMGGWQQDRNVNPFHKWMLCGINGSCSDLSPLTALLGGSISGRSNVSCTHHSTLTTGKSNFSCTTIHEVQNATAFPPSPVCVYPPFLFILSNNSFDSCSNDTCFLSQCWDALNYANALVVRIPR